MVNFFFLLILLFFNEALAEESLEVNADQFTYDKDNTRIFATGNVEIIDKEFKLYADKVFLNNTSKVLSAQENIKIFNMDGTILTAEKIVADQSLKNAIINKNYIYFPRKTSNYGDNFLRLAAEKVERRNGTWEKMDYGIFTACEICYNEKTKKNDEPLVQFKAKKIIHDKKNMKVNYYDVFLDFKGTSILYLPYFSHASPLIKRKSGFLAPKIFQTHFFGLGSDIPYYYPINEFHDFTIIPKFTQKKNPSIFFEHRKNFFNGEIKTQVSGTIENQEVHLLKKNKNRGHIKTEGSFDLSTNSYVDFKLHKTTDKNYLNTYKYGYQDVLDSYLKLRTLKKYNFYSFETHFFQDLRKDVNQREVHKIYPRFQLSLNSEKKFNAFNYSTNIEAVNISRSKGSELKKIFVNQDIKLPILFRDGSILEIGGHLNAGGYHIEKYNNPSSGEFENSKYKFNYFPQATLQISKPYYQKKKNSASIITPKALFVSGNKKAYSRDIPNYTDLNFDFDITDLFNRNRLSGNDRHDSNSRIDYGISFLKNSLQFNKNTLFEIGQSYHFEKQRYLNKNSGINDNFSDIVSRVQFKPNNDIFLNSFFSLNKKNYSIRTARNQLSLGGNYTNFVFNHIYSTPFVSDDGTDEIEKKNQFSFSLNQKLIDNWSFTGASTFDKKEKIKFHNFGAKIKYEDECFGLSLTWNRYYTHNSEDPTSNSFMFMFSFKEIMENDL